MKHPQIPVRMYSSKGIVPDYAYSLASGCDIRADIDDDIRLLPLQRVLVPTSLYIELPPGYEAQIRPRSGKAMSKGLSLPNAPATIDADYRGEILVACINLHSESITISPGEKIAQLVIAPLVQAHFLPQEALSNLTDSLRQARGFGSSGE